ncbi:MAG: hypothetical protein PVF49_11105 [Anaerolineales bacterium]|jgi:hypothetical protein
MEWTIFKISLIGFWAGWFSLVTFTNAVDLLTRLAWTDRLPHFRSGNFELVTEVTGKHGFPYWANMSLFTLVIAIEAGTGLLFWRALFALAIEGSGVDTFTLTLPILPAIVLFGGFMLASEFFQVYTKEDTFVRILILLLVSSLVLIYWP